MYLDQLFQKSGSVHKHHNHHKLFSSIQALIGKRDFLGVCSASMILSPLHRACKTWVGLMWIGAFAMTE